MHFVESINRHARLSRLPMGDLILSEEWMEVVGRVREDQEEGKDGGGTVVGTKMNHIIKSLTASMSMQVQWFMVCFLNPWTRSHSSYIHSSIQAWRTKYISLQINCSLWQVCSIISCFFPRDMTEQFLWQSASVS